MKKKLLLATVLCMLAFCLFAISINAECTEHTYKWTVEMGNNGFLGEINAEGVCSTCGDAVSEKIPSVFVALGYSYSDNGVTQGYAVNREALAKYENITGEKVTFGAVVATRNAIGDSNPLNSKGESVSEKVKTIDFTDTKYDIIDVAVRGIPEELMDSADIIFAMYVNAGGRITYLDNCVEKINCGARSYNDVKNEPKAEAPALDKVTFIEGKRYKPLDIDFVKAKYWYGTTLQESANNATFNNKFWGTSVSYTKDDLPNGTIILLDSANGWQYRPHKWGTGSRPSNTKANKVVIDDYWWTGYTNVGFNISMYKGGTGATDTTDSMENISGYTEEQIAEIFKIYIPIENTVPTERPDYSEQKQDWNDDNALKILTIGNSFSTDSMEYVYQVAKAAGIEAVVLGNLYIGGCSLDTHYSNALNNSNAYTYYTNSNGTWSSKGGMSIKAAVESEDWDFISMQQVSGYSGVESSYSNLDKLVDIVEPLNPSARLVWHMTWAYQAGSGHSDFGKYNRDQMTMYNAIVGTTQSQIVSDGKFDIIIPAGTSIQNVRTSYIGDTLTRDGYHLSYDLGRFIGSLTFVKALTGISIDNVTYAPDGVDENELAVAIECVNNACKTPFSVTSSEYTKSPTASKVPAGYRQLTLEELGLTQFAYYNTDANHYNLIVTNSSDGTGKKFYATAKFTPETLPVGSIIIVEDGWQYRPERWTKIGNRPGNVSTHQVYVDEAWWSTYASRAFNISRKDSATMANYTAEDIYSIFKIYVPDSSVEMNQMPVDDLGLVSGGYWHSNDTEADHYELHTANGDSYRFYATRKFTKEELPVGSVIIVEEGWLYRPEGWIDGAKNVSRPNSIDKYKVIITEAWWGDFTERAFNIGKKNGASIEEYTEEQIAEIFKIYTPTAEAEEVTR